MNVFILCTGRCGSTTFVNACKHIKNYSSSHESRTGKIGDDRFKYPRHHIEADNRLSWLLGRLDQMYGDDAFYVHLTRNMDETILSFVRRYNRGIMKAYRGDGILLGLSDEESPEAVARDYCETVNKNIQMFLREKTRKMDFRLEDATLDFPVFCDLVGADIKIDDGLAEFSKKYNAS